MKFNPICAENPATMFDLRFFYIVKKMMRWAFNRPPIKFENDHQSALAGNKQFLSFGRVTEDLPDYDHDQAIGIYVMKTYFKYFFGKDLDMGYFIKSQSILVD